jgi:soluble lytic murein transglycosylase
MRIPSEIAAVTQRIAEIEVGPRLVTTEFERLVVVRRNEARESPPPAGPISRSTIDRFIDRSAAASGIDPALLAAIISNESGFNPYATSGAGARGLMQLMPGTAATVAHEIGTSVTPVALVFDPQQNMRLGTAYLRELLDHYRGALPLALAAYNAGPGRVDQWLSENGDPRVEPPAGSVGMPAGSIDMVDWIELIPFAETRDYVQRVLENVVIYRARRGEATPTLLAQWTR